MIPCPHRDRAGNTYLFEYTEHAYGRLLSAMDGITEDELRWNLVPEMNTAGKIRHAARISLILLLQVVEGTTTGDWDRRLCAGERGLEGPTYLQEADSG